MTFSFNIPTPTGARQFEVEPGTTLLVLGANGGGKTRLAVKIEELLGEQAHRIPAHRGLTLNPDVSKVSERAALRGLRLGNSHESSTLLQRASSRWGDAPAVKQVNDYDFLVQALFADQTSISLETHRNMRVGLSEAPKYTKFEKLVEIWNRLLPKRELKITGDDIRVVVTGTNDNYAAAEMSDGERSIFYLLGQTLTAAENTLIIFDEPELHIHRGIMSRLWDEIEAVRADCGLVCISHDLEFIASRQGQKVVIQDFSPSSGWVIEPVPEDAGFSEETTVLILGSRKPILFVEGDARSLDRAIYRACYPKWTVVPRGSCEAVIHAVATMRANSHFTRVACTGIVDADSRTPEEIAGLEKMGIKTLPVSQIENIFILPQVAEAIARSEGFDGAELQTKLDSVAAELIRHASDIKTLEGVIAGYCRRVIEQRLRRIDLSGSSNPKDIAASYSSLTNAIDVSHIASEAQDVISAAIATKDIPILLRWYDNKGVMGIACKLKGTKKDLFEQWILRTLSNSTAPGLRDAIVGALPELDAE